MIWLKQVTLVSWTQPSSLLCLWQSSQNWKENMRCMQNFAIPTQIMNESAQCICTESLSNPVPPIFPPTHTCATTLFELKTKTKSSHQRRVRSASRQWTWSDKKVPISVIGIRSATHFPPFSFFSQCCYAHHSFSLGVITIIGGRISFYMFSINCSQLAFYCPKSSTHIKSEIFLESHILAKF